MGRKFDIRIIGALILMLMATSCGQDKDLDKKKNKLIANNHVSFSKVDPKLSNIGFANRIRETRRLNYFTFPYMYAGAGVSVGDLDNDGLPDIYFTGNMVKNELYRNNGNLQFTNITDDAKVGAMDMNRWVTGTTMADVNNDGWLDIYVCVSGPYENRKNLLFINKGDMTFDEKAEEYGLADNGFSVQSSFFDYDLDGDLDMYLATYPPFNFQSPNQFFVEKNGNPRESETDRLYRNEGNGKYVDVTDEAGVINYGLTLSASVADFNNDDWPDIYVSNDFNSPDFLYINNGDGTFTDKLSQYMNHTSNFGMGADVGDINNDGNLDLLQLDMMGDTNKDRKTNMSAMAPEIFYEAVDFGLHHQYMKNSMQLNNGDGTFSDIAELSGIAKTSWSWGPLIADLNNDGFKDVYITNGIRRNVNDNDFLLFNQKLQALGQINGTNQHRLLRRMPVSPVDNYVFVNNGDLTFKKALESSGLSYKGFSHGAAYTDFDNDGDLDIAINNMDDNALIFENLLNDSVPNAYIKVKLNGVTDNRFGIGAKVKIVTNGVEQTQQLSLSKGYQSSVPPILHFGVGNFKKIDAIEVKWPNGCVDVYSNITVNKLVTFTQKQNCSRQLFPEKKEPLLKSIKVENPRGLDYVHKENDFDDFKREVLLPHRMSRHGPALAVSDVNGDGLDDIFVGGAKGQSGILYLQDEEAFFHPMENGSWLNDRLHEDVFALLFDADGDTDKDLYVVSGGNEEKKDSEYYQDRLYINDGKGNFKKAPEALPRVTSSGSCVRECDFDGDGDLDLFVGGRQIPGGYPIPASSQLLRNDSQGGKIVFTDVTAKLAPQLNELGMVTDAVWSDVNSDKKPDLVLVGEWMPIMVFLNQEIFKDITEEKGLLKQTGWWNSVASGDFDGDGDMDLIAGNLGLNYKYKASETEPFEIYARDFDGNGTLDLALGYYENNLLYPVRGRQCSSQQVPDIKKKFPTYKAFANATFDEIYDVSDLNDTYHYQAQRFATTYFENQGNGFVPHDLENEAQISSVNVIVPGDYNGDGHTDLILAGNLYGSEVETPRNDASYGLLVTGDGKGNFDPKKASETGLSIRGEVRAAAVIHLANGDEGIIFARNNDRLKLVVTKWMDNN